MAADVLSQLVGALQSRAHLGLKIAPAPWADFAGKIPATPENLGGLHVLVAILIDRSDLTSTGRAAVGQAARNLFDAMSQDAGRINWLTKSVTPFVAKTYDTDIAASRARLQQVFEPERFASFGHLEAPWLAREILKVAAADPDFAVEIYYRTFLGGDFKPDQTTTMTGGWILPLTSNASQDFSMAGFALADAYPKLLRDHPEIAIRALAATLKGMSEAHPRPGEPPAIQPVPFQETTAPFVEDRSSIWGWKLDHADREDESKIYQAFLAWVATAQADLLQRAIELIVQETGSALAWRAMFAAGTSRPAELGVRLWPSASAAAILLSEDAQQSAIDLIAATYPHLLPQERQAFEERWLAHEFSGLPNPERRRERLLGTIFGTIGPERVETQAARDFLAAAKAAGRRFENREPIDVELTWGRDCRHWLESKGVDVEAPDIAPIIARSEALTAALASIQVNQGPDALAQVWTAIEALDQALRSADLSLNPLVDNDASDTLARGLGCALRVGAAPTVARAAAAARLLELSEHPNPTSDADVEARFMTDISWSSPATRIQAAEALARLVTTRDIWPVIRPRVETLMLEDPHPAVRFTIMRVIRFIGSHDPEHMWALIERAAAEETNAAVVAKLVANLRSFRVERADRIEAIVLELADRFGGVGYGPDNDPITSIIVDFAIEDGREASQAKLRGWIADYVAQEGRLHRVLGDLRGAMVARFTSDTEAARTIAARCDALVSDLIAAIEPAVRSWPLRGGEPTPEELAAFKLFRAAGEDLYYAVGRGDDLPEWLEPTERQRAFLEDKAALISRLTTLGDPGTVHNLIELLGKLTDADAERCFDLFSEAMLRTTGVAKYQHEPMGAARFVELVGRYLADHRSIFDDETRRQKLVDCIALFVDAGWPEARRLFQSLPELIQ